MIRKIILKIILEYKLIPIPKVNLVFDKESFSQTSAYILETTFIISFSIVTKTFSYFFPPKDLMEMSTLFKIIGTLISVSSSPSFILLEI